MPEVIERITPGRTYAVTFREHEARYQFAGRYVFNKIVLDAACGPGIGTDYLRRVGAASCLGIDIDPGAVAKAKEQYPESQFCIGNVLLMPFEDATFEAIISFETIEHVAEQEKFLSECRRLLRPGGTLICSTPHHRVTKWTVGDNPYHVRELNVEEFEALLSRYFSEVTLYGQDVVNYPEMLFRQSCVRLLKWMHLKELVLRSMGKLTIETAVQFAVPREGDPIFARYSHGWIKQPSYVVAVCRLGDEESA